jgi:hypothetical protein
LQTSEYPGTGAQDKDFYSEDMETCASPMLNVLFVGLNSEGKVSKIRYGNHWKAVYDLLAERNQKLSEAIDGKFNNGYVIVTGSAYVGPNRVHQKVIEELMGNLAKNCDIEGAVIDVRNTRNPNGVQKMGKDELLTWMEIGNQEQSD